MFTGFQQPLVYDALVPPVLSVMAKLLPCSRITLSSPLVYTSLRAMSLFYHSLLCRRRIAADLNLYQSLTGIITSRNNTFFLHSWHTFSLSVWVPNGLMIRIFATLLEPECCSKQYFATSCLYDLLDFSASVALLQSSCKTIWEHLSPGSNLTF